MDLGAGEGAGGLNERAPNGAIRPVTLGLVLLCLGGILLVGGVHKMPCASGDWLDGRQYRLACYTDIVPLFGTEQLAGGRLPYLDPCTPSGGNCDEYPVLTMYFMRAAGWVSGDDPERFFWVNAFLLSVCAAVAAGCLYLIDARRAIWFALAPTLALQVFVNWDLLAVALATAATLAFVRRRDGWAGVLIGLGAAAKLYPVLLLIPFAADRLRGHQPDRAILLWWSAAATWITVNLPFAATGLSGWWEFFRFNGARQADWDSAWYVLCHRLSLCVPTGLINIASLALLVALTSWVWMAKRHREPDFPRWQLAFPILVLFLLVGKVYSPQFSLWLLPWLVLILPGPRRFLAFEAADLAVFLTRFSFFGDLTEVGGLPQGVFETALLVRAGVLIWCVVAWVREPSRRLPDERASDRALPAAHA
ncbi:MAG TPA: glycosyltransferase 87 family protein [Actinomycetota bacterium]|nr:glycosyltransferase 87 family protein [Actinomycetota bacterium]